jgi:hypothetical protein
MISLRRTGAVLAAFALAITTISAGLLPCNMTAGPEGDVQAATAHVHHASADQVHHGDGRISDHADESDGVASCPVMGPCSLHLLAASDVGRAVRTLAGSRMIESPALVPPSRTLAPELPPPRV